MLVDWLDFWEFKKPGFTMFLTAISIWQILTSLLCQCSQYGAGAETRKGFVLKPIFVAIFLTLYFPIVSILRKNVIYCVQRVVILLMQIRMLFGWWYCKYTFLCYFCIFIWIDFNLQTLSLGIRIGCIRMLLVILW